MTAKFELRSVRIFNYVQQCFFCPVCVKAIIPWTYVHHLSLDGSSKSHIILQIGRYMSLYRTKYNCTYKQTNQPSTSCFTPSVVTIILTSKMVSYVFLMSKQNHQTSSNVLHGFTSSPSVFNMSAPFPHPHHAPPRPQRESILRSPCVLPHNTSKVNFKT